MKRSAGLGWSFAIGLALMGIASSAASGAAGEATPDLDPRLEEKGWNLFAHPKWEAARFHLAEDGSICVATDNSTALIWRVVPEDWRTKRVLTWQWRVDQTMPPTDIRFKGGDDRPIAFHVWFEEPPERETLWKSLRAGVLRLLFGVPISGRVLTYVWGGTGTPGDEQPNPHVGEDSWMIVLRNGTTPTGVWLNERVDLAADYRRGFGDEPLQAQLIAIAGDSEDTKTRSVALIKNITFTN